MRSRLRASTPKPTASHIRRIWRCRPSVRTKRRNLSPSRRTCIGRSGRSSPGKRKPGFPRRSIACSTCASAQSGGLCTCTLYSFSTVPASPIMCLQMAPLCEKMRRPEESESNRPATPILCSRGSGGVGSWHLGARLDGTSRSLACLCAVVLRWPGTEWKETGLKSATLIGSSSEAAGARSVTVASSATRRSSSVDAHTPLTRTRPPVMSACASFREQRLSRAISSSSRTPTRAGAPAIPSAQVQPVVPTTRGHARRVVCLRVESVPRVSNVSTPRSL
mmetsp:Transcript_12351/g.31205  ORF Transcript_12351/g.31205 Transcript_12351/m.31205 type:complete len:278 (-) Transcript_12351:40-873(-)